MVAPLVNGLRKQNAFKLICANQRFLFPGSRRELPFVSFSALDGVREIPKGGLFAS